MSDYVYLFNLLKVIVWESWQIRELLIPSYYVRKQLASVFGMKDRIPGIIMEGSVAF